MNFQALAAACSGVRSIPSPPGSLQCSTLVVSGPHRLVHCRGVQSLYCRQELVHRLAKAWSTPDLGMPLSDFGDLIFAGRQCQVVLQCDPAEAGMRKRSLA